MRSLWSGSISFGLVNIPVRLFTATRENNIRFHLMSSDGQCRLREKLYCPTTGKEYDFSETSKSYEVSPGEYVLIDKKEIERLKPEKGNSIDILDFVHAEEVDPIYFQKTYFLGPDKRAGKPYKLLLEVIREKQMVAIGKFVMRNKEYLCVIREKEGCLCLQTLYYAKEVLSSEDIPLLKEELHKVKITARELEMGVKLVDKMIVHFKPESYHNTYQQELQKLVDARARGRKVRLPEIQGKPAKVLDLMEALRRSVGKSERSKKRTTNRGHRRAA